MTTRTRQLGIGALATAALLAGPAIASAQCHTRAVRRVYTTPTVITYQAPAPVVTVPVYTQPVYVAQPVVATTYTRTYTPALSVRVSSERGCRSYDYSRRYFRHSHHRHHRDRHGWSARLRVNRGHHAELRPEDSSAQAPLMRVVARR